jgi:phage tail sheath protein FI
MAEYLAPGVYVEEVSFRGASIEGVGTTTTGFVGVTRTGPVAATPTSALPPWIPTANGTVAQAADGSQALVSRPELLTSFGDFTRIYGGLDALALAGSSDPINYLAHSVKAFFDNGGSLLYVSRVFGANTPAAGAFATFGYAYSNIFTTAAMTTPPAAAPAGTSLQFVSRFPGREGNGSVRLDVVGALTAQSAQAGLPAGSVLATVTPGAAGSPPTLAGFVKQNDGTFNPALPTGAGGGPAPQLYTVTATLTFTSASGVTVSYNGLGLDPAHPRWIGSMLAAVPYRRQDYLEQPIAVEVGGPSPNGADMLTVLGFAVSKVSTPGATLPFTTKLSITVPMVGGDDGETPSAGQIDNALLTFEPLEDISIVAAPGSSAYGNADATAAVYQGLLAHVSRPRAYRVAVLDTPAGQMPSDVQTMKSGIDSTYAALYYPWVRIANPLAQANNSQIPQEINLPPSGFICGIYARSDNANGVFKAPANEVVIDALGFERNISFGQQELLNPLGINCLRSLPNRGNRVWGARTISSNPDFTYISVRRYMIYLEASIDNGLQWAVFESNGPALWTRVREALDDFLRSEWTSGALLGDTPQQAYFVKCDRSTMTQADLDNGRMVCLIGVAVIKPAEFVIFRIGQKTADATN